MQDIDIVAPVGFSCSNAKGTASNVTPPACLKTTMKTDDDTDPLPSSSVGDPYMLREPNSASDSSLLGVQSILTVMMIAAVVAATVAVYGVRMSMSAFTTTKAVQLLPTPNASEIAYLPRGTGAVTTNVQAKLHESVSAKDYGADVPGDVTKQLQNALDGGKDCALLLTPGHVYSISATLFVRQGCTVAGSGATLINNIYQGNPFQIAESNVTIDNLTIQNTAHNKVYTIKDSSVEGADVFINSVKVKVRNVVLRNLTVNGSIEFSSAITGNGDCESVLIENVVVNGGKFVDCFSFEWNYRGGTAAENIITPKNIQFLNCTANGNNQLSGFDWNYGWWLSACINVKLTNCTANHCKNGATLIAGVSDCQLPTNYAPVLFSQCCSHSVDCIVSYRMVYDCMIDCRIMEPPPDKAG
jgi:hypothetical protein